MKRFLIRIYLWFMGVSICGHPASGLRYCPTCDSDQKDIRYNKYVRGQQKLERLRKEFLQ